MSGTARRGREGASTFEPGRNCWRIARADKFAFIVNGAEYFRRLRQVMMSARRDLLLIGWDFDFEIEMLPGESDAEGLAPDGMPNVLGEFIEAVAERTSELHIYLLKWNGAMVVAPGRILPTIGLSLFGSDRIHFALDGHHPFGACHHQKIVVADDTFAFCGGIDTTEDRWDTSDHIPNDPRRVRKDGSPAPPWHDVTSAMTGPVASALGELSRQRWHRATGESLDDPTYTMDAIWPHDLDVLVEDVDVAVARTEPPFDGTSLVDEIEQLYLDQIAAAQRSIYIESQYFAAEKICRALEDRLREEDGPEIVVVNPKVALSAIEDRAMHVIRSRVIARMEAADPGGRFRIFYPVTTAGEPIYIHAKVFIVDDRIIRIGSSNLNDRSMGFDTECDIAFERSGDETEMIAAFRAKLLAEHLGVSPAEVREAHAETGSIIGAIYALEPRSARGFVPILQRQEDMIDTWFADSRVLDPRYHRGEITDSGRGFRPRHLAVIAGAAGLGVLGWLAWKRWAGRPTERS